MLWLSWGHPQLAPQNQPQPYFLCLLAYVVARISQATPQCSPHTSHRCYRTTRAGPTTVPVLTLSCGNNILAGESLMFPYYVHSELCVLHVLASAVTLLVMICFQSSSLHVPGVEI